LMAVERKRVMPVLWIETRRFCNNCDWAIEANEILLFWILTETHLHYTVGAITSSVKRTEMKAFCSFLLVSWHRWVGRCNFVFTCCRIPWSRKSGLYTHTV
jgi:hypothetical protein